MPQQHLDRLTSIDASFLHQEGRASHMHIGGVLVFEGPPPAFADYLDHVRSRLHLVPRYRQKLAVPPLQAGRPVWVDDPSFNLAYHVRHTALPAPGTERELLLLVARIASQQLDRAKPLWESWLVEGLSEGRFALIFKTHHALVDGISGVDLATVLFDTTREPSRASAARRRRSGTASARKARCRDGLDRWRPHPEPTGPELVLAGVRGMVSAVAGLAARAIGAAASPAATLTLARDVLEGVGELAWAVLNPAPETPLNVPIGPHRRYAVVRQQLCDYKTIKDELGGTVNDVVLTVVSGALARWLRSRGVRTEGLELRALVPVSVRTPDQQGTLGNQLTAMRGPLPVLIEDPVARLRYVRAAMEGLKESKQAIGAATLAAVNNLAPPTLLAQASRLQFSTRLFNLLVTNVPGPQVPLYVLGRELRDLFPLAFLPRNHALAVAIMSYNGRIEYGLLGDYDALGDIDLIADGIQGALQELLSAAGGEPTHGRARGGRPRRPARRSPGRPPARRDGRRATAAADGGQPAPTQAAPEPTQRAPEPTQAAPEPTAPAQAAPEPTAPAQTPLVPTGPRPSHGPAADMRARRTRSSTRRPRPAADTDSW